MTKITLRYDAELGRAIADGNVERWWDGVLVHQQLGYTYEIVVGSYIAIDRARLGVKEGQVKAEDIEIRFQDYVIMFDPQGNLDYWPAGFCDYQEKIWGRLFDFEWIGAAGNESLENPIEGTDG